MKFIDCHVHCFPDTIAEKAVANLANTYELVPSFDGTIAGLMRQMDELGIQASFLQCVATKPSQVQSINNWLAEIQSQRLIPFGAIHPDLPEPEKELCRLKELGIKGIKLHGNWQGFRLDDERMFPIYQAAEENFIMYFHAGGEIVDCLEVLATPKALKNVHQRFPRLKMVCAHMGGYKMWDEVEKHLLGTNVYFDMSYCFPNDMPDEQMVKYIRLHGAEKILFGSDSPCGNPKLQMDRLLSLPITDEEKELIAWKNAVQLLSDRKR
ncbi:MAG: amidohydrolase family protein [Armatimonadota bacterium]|nr:amidohydrolase family protein [Armatimonadota bacterium]